MDRDASERALEEAALRLLERDGVLAGLNLREVADEAGVNRGLVYHYFGSRQELLRSALVRDVAPRLAQAEARADRPLRERTSEGLRALVRARDSVRLGTLLMLDGDPDMRLMPLLERGLEAFAHDVERGDLDAQTDARALSALLTSALYGYVLYRASLARELDLPARELDARVEALFDRLLRGLRPGGAAEPEEEEPK
jgi:AcrR family transcriptional regulator